MSSTVEPPTTYASVAARLGGYLVDGAVSVGVFLIASLIGVGAGAANLSGVGLVLTVALPVGYGIAVTVSLGKRGYTPGMKVAGLRTLDADTEAPIGFGRALVRQVVLGVLGCLNVIQLLTIGHHPRRQGWHDLAARSVVVTAASVAASRASGAATAATAGVADAGARSPAPLAAPASAGGSLATPPHLATHSVPPSPPGQSSPPPLGSAMTMVPPPPGILPAPPGEVVPTPETVRGPVSGPPTPGVASPASAPATVTWTLCSSTGEVARIGALLVVGRDPDPALFAGAERWAVDDPDLSVSKTHAVFGVEGGAPWVEDWNSTNGVEVRRGGDVQALSPQQRTRVQAGDLVVLGNLEITVERS